MLGYIKHVLKADAVAIVWNFYTRDPYKDLVGRVRCHAVPAERRHPHPASPSGTGLQVEYRPVILVIRKANPWAGLIKPVPRAGLVHATITGRSCLT